MIGRFLLWLRRDSPQAAISTAPAVGTQAHRHWWLRRQGADPASTATLIRIGRAEEKLRSRLSALDRKCPGQKLRASRYRLQSQVTRWIEPSGELEQSFARIAETPEAYDQLRTRTDRLVAEAERVLAARAILEDLEPRLAALHRRFAERLPGLWKVAAGVDLEDAFNRVVSPAGGEILRRRIDSLERTLSEREEQFLSFLQEHGGPLDTMDLEQAAEELRVAIMAQSKKSVKESAKRVKAARKQHRALR